MKLTISHRLIINNEKGEITFLGFTVLLFILSFSFFIILKQLLQLQDIKESSKKHLCIKYLYVETEKYVSKITKLNYSIRTGFAMSLIPATTAQGKALNRVSKNAQNLIHVSYLKNIITNDYCEMTFKTKYLRTLPYSTRKIGNLLKRNFDGTTIIRKNKWKHHFLILKKPRILELVRISYSIQNSFSYLEGNINLFNNQAFKPSSLLSGYQ